MLLVMEEMAGDLCHALHQAGDTYQWHRLGKRVALQIAEGLAYLHFRGIIHLDLKSGERRLPCFCRRLWKTAITIILI